MMAADNRWHGNAPADRPIVPGFSRAVPVGPCSIAPGMDADLVGIDPASSPAIAQGQGGARAPRQVIFPMIMMGGDLAHAVIRGMGRWIRWIWWGRHLSGEPDDACLGCVVAW